MSEWQNQLQELRRNATAGTLKPVKIRRQVLKKLLVLLQDNRQQILNALAADLHKSEEEALTCELALLYSSLRYAIRHVKGWARPKLLNPGVFNLPGIAWQSPEPYGVALIGATWNYPFLLSLDPLIGAISAGNCAILRIPDYAIHSGAVIKELIDRLEMPGVIAATAAPWDELLTEKYDYIFFTGGTAMGRKIMMKAAENLTPVTLELGGKSPCIVTENADIDVAAKRIAWGKFLNAGQTCVAPDFLYVHSAIKDKLTAKIRFYIKRFYGENPQESGSFGRIISDYHFERLTRLSSAGRLICGGEWDKNERYIAPTLIDMVDWESPVMQEEIFGPILPVLTFDSLEEAIVVLKSKPKPLAAYIFSKSGHEEAKFIRECSFGNMAVNDTIMQLAAATIPFGGVGASGTGAYHGKWSFDTFTHYRSILKKPLWELPLRYPPFNAIQKLLIRLACR